MLINGHTEVIAHIGFPTYAFKAPMIYNPYFEQLGINALVVPSSLPRLTSEALISSSVTVPYCAGSRLPNML